MDGKELLSLLISKSLTVRLVLTDIATCVGRTAWLCSGRAQCGQLERPAELTARRAQRQTRGTSQLSSTRSVGTICNVKAKRRGGWVKMEKAEEGLAQTHAWMENASRRVSQGRGCGALEHYYELSEAVEPSAVAQWMAKQFQRVRRPSLPPISSSGRPGLVSQPGVAMDWVRSQVESESKHSSTPYDWNTHLDYSVSLQSQPACAPARSLTLLWLSHALFL